MNEVAVTPATSAELRAGRRISLIVAANALSVTGSALNLIALVTLLYGSSGGALSVGIVVLIGFLPVVIAMPLVGPRLAPSSPRRLLVCVSLTQAVVVAGMAVDASTPHAHRALLYAAAGALGLGAMMTRVATYTVLPRVVPSGRLPRVNLSLQVSSQVGAAVGALIVVFAHDSPAWALFTADAATFAVQAAFFALALSGLVVAADGPAGARSAPPSRKPQLSRVAALFYVLVPVGFIALNVVNVTLPLQALAHLQAGQRGFAAGEFVYPLAAIACGLILRRRDSLPRLGVCVALIATGLLLLAWSPTLSVLLAAVLVVGAGNVLSNAVSQSLLQRSLHGAELGAMQGRAAGVGAAVSAPAVLGIAWGFEHRVGGVIVLVIGCCFAALAAVASVAEHVLVSAARAAD